MSNKKKYQELIKYICVRVQENSQLSKTKLFKILFLCDFNAYRELGNSISGDNYIRMPYGPVPTHAGKELSGLIKRGKVVESQAIYNGNPGKQLVSTVKPDLSEFSPDEISIIDQQIEIFKMDSAKYLSDYSHNFIGWKVIEDGKNIPYGTALLQYDDDLIQEDFSFTEEYLKKACNDAEEAYKTM